MRELVAPVLLRRSRLDLLNIEVYKQDLDRQGISFAKVHDPELQIYLLGDLSDRYIQTLEHLSPEELSDEDEYELESEYQARETATLPGMK
jgi:hypothetical protein